jgi:two-component system, NarL family, sensor kinase
MRFFINTESMKKILSALLFLCLLSAQAQNAYIDSLKTELEKSKDDTNKVFILTDIAEELAEIDFKKSLDYSNKGKDLSEKLNFKKGLAQVYSTIANAYSGQSDYANCLEFNIKALEIRRALKNNSEIAKSLVNIGNVYNDQSDFTNALIYYNQCLEIQKKIKDKKEIAKLYNNIGNAYANKGDLKQSIDYLFQSLKLKEELGNKKGVANTCNNIAVIYKMQGNLKEALMYNQKALKYRIELKDSNGIGASYTNIGITYRNLKEIILAEDNYLKALEIFKKLGYNKGIATVNNDLGVLYKINGDLEKARLAYERALKMFEIQNDKAGIANALSNIAFIYGKKKNFSMADGYFKKAERLLPQVNSFETTMDIYDTQSQYYEAKGDFKNALKYHLLYSANRDSLRSKENTTSINEVKTRYETAIKIKENNSLKFENTVKDLSLSKKDTQRNILLFVFFSALIIGALLFNRFKLMKQKELSLQLITEQELRSKAMIEAEEKERTRIARELHDGIGQQLSAAKLNISSLQSALKTNSETEKMMLQNAVDLIDESVKEVRQVSHSMMPNALIKSGLVSAIREFINKISTSGSLKINLEIVGLTERLEQTIETVLFRVLQELVNNIIKHANATEVSIQFIRHEKELTVMVEDNGVGFKVEKKLNEINGIGLKNIQSRVEFLNGQVFFDSQINKGTTVTVEIPIQ